MSFIYPAPSSISGTFNPSSFTDNETNSISQLINVDDQRNISDVNNLTANGVITAGSVSANSLTGTLTTTAQPTISSVGTLASLAVTGAITSGSVSATTLSGALTTAAQPNITSIGTMAADLKLAATRKIALNGQATPLATIDLGAVSTDRSIALFNNGTHYYGLGSTGSQLRSYSAFGHGWYAGASSSVIGTSIMSLSSAGVLSVDTVSATTLSGVLAAGAQTGISSVGTLSTLAVTGAVSAGSVSATTLSGTLSAGAQTGISSVGTLSTLAVTGAVSAGSVSATTLSGTLASGAQNGISSVGTLASLAVTGAVSAGSVSATTLSGTLSAGAQTGISSVGTLASLAVTGAITSGTVSATTLSGTLASGAQNGISSVGTLASLAVTGAITSGSVSATILSGTLAAGAQTGISSVGTLASLAVTGAVSAGSVSATTLSGTLAAGAQNGISSVGTLATLAVTGAITSGTVSATTLSGTLSAGAQNGISSVGTLASLAVTGAITSGSVSATTLSGTLAAGAQNGISSVGTLASLAVTGAITSGTVSATTLSGTLSAGAQTGISSVGTLASLAVTGAITSGSVSATTLSGTLAAGAQPNITSIGTMAADLKFAATRKIALNAQATPLATIDLGAVSTDRSIALFNNGGAGWYGLGATGSQLRYHSSFGHGWYTGASSTVIGAQTMSLSSAGLLAVDTVSATTLNATTINLGGTDISTLLGTPTSLNIAVIGTAEASKALVLDASKNIIGINAITSDYITTNTALNCANATGTFKTVNTGGAALTYGSVSIKGNTLNQSPVFGSANSILWMESSHASPIEAELSISSASKTTTTNALRFGTNTLNDFSLYTNSTERLLIRSSGEVAIKKSLQIGDSTDTTRLLSALDDTMGVGQNRYITLGKANSTGNQAEVAFAYAGNGNEDNSLSFGFHGGEKMRLTNAGGLLINGIAQNYGGQKTKLSIEASGFTEWAAILKNNSATASKMVGFYNQSNAEVGSIQLGNASTAFNTTSDYRLKENIQPLSDCLERINKLNPVSWKWKASGEDGEGFVADQLQIVLPNCVTGEKDALYPDGSIDAQSVDYGRLSYVLAGAVRELTQKMDDQQALIEKMMAYPAMAKFLAK